jgi:hypothetical protein
MRADGNYNLLFKFYLIFIIIFSYFFNKIYKFIIDYKKGL